MDGNCVYSTTSISDELRASVFESDLTAAETLELIKPSTQRILWLVKKLDAETTGMWWVVEEPYVYISWKSWAASVSDH